jgi:LacI family transcriptional regulator
MFGRVAKALLDSAVPNNMRITVSQTNERHAAAPDLSGRHVDGIIGHDVASEIEAYLAGGRGTAAVVSTGPGRTLLCDSVGVDLHQGSLLAVRRLVEKGCRHISYISTQEGMSPNDPRCRAFNEVCSEAGIEPGSVIIDFYNRRTTREAIRAHLEYNASVDGLFCWNDHVAIVANRAARDCGRSVPGDIAIIGSDGIEDIEFHVPSISTVAQPVEQMIDLAWSFLLRRMNDPDAELRHELLPMNLIERESTQR